MGFSIDSASVGKVLITYERTLIQHNRSCSVLTGNLYNPSEAVKGGDKTVQQTLILEVFDNLSGREPNKSYSRMTLAVVPPVFLPSLTR